MPDLYAINLHLQKRLESDWRDEVRAVEAARWLDKARLLPDDQNRQGRPLRRLLRAGRIAGQEQRPNKKNGRWFIRRLAESRDTSAIWQARERMRRYLPIKRGHLHPDWPVSQGPAVFWQELGKTVAAFGELEHTLALTCYTLLATAERAAEVRDASDEALSQWYERIVRSQTDSLYRLTQELENVLTEADVIPHTVREDLRARLDELRPWRNALCHGAWLSVDKDGSASLHHMYRHKGVPVRFPPVVTLKDLSDIRARTVDVTIRIAEAASVAGAGYALATVMPRMYEPRNVPPEPE